MEIILMRLRHMESAGFQKCLTETLFRREISCVKTTGMVSIQFTVSSVLCMFSKGVRRLSE